MTKCTQQLAVYYKLIYIFNNCASAVKDSAKDNGHWKYIGEFSKVNKNNLAEESGPQYGIMELKGERTRG